MKVIDTSLPDVKIIEPKVFEDARGFFFESFNSRVFEQEIAAGVQFTQDNHSRSSKGVLRGMHYQIRHPQGKLVHVLSGEVFDVAVDLRRSSPTFGKWAGALLSAENKRHMWIPPGFAHGFVVLSDTAEFFYKTADFWYPEHERCLLWNDPDVAVDWPIDFEPILAKKDAAAQRLRDAEVYE